MAWTQNLLGLCFFGCAPDAAFLGLGHDFIVFRGSKSNTFSLFLGAPKATFRDFWGCTPAIAWTQNLLGLCFFGCAPDAAFLGFAWWMQFRSGWGTISLFLEVPKAKQRFEIFEVAVPQWLGRKTCWGSAFSDALPTQLSCLVAEVSQWLGHDFIVFRGSNSNVSRFLRLQFRNGLDFRMRSRRSFLGLSLAAAVSQWLGHDFIVFRGSKSNTFSLFLGVPKATFRDFWGCTPAMAWTQNLLGLCFFGCAPDAAFLGFAWWLQFRSGWGTISLGVPKATFRDFWGCTPAMAWTQNLLGLCFFGCAPDAAFLGFAWWLQFRSGWGTISLFFRRPLAKGERA